MQNAAPRRAAPTRERGLQAASPCTPHRHCPPPLAAAPPAAGRARARLGTHTSPRALCLAMAPRSVPRDKAECPRAGEAAVPRSPVSGDRRALWGQLRRGKVPGVTPPARPRDTGTTRERPAHGRDLPGGRAASSPSPQLGMGQLLATCRTALGRSQVPAPRAAAPHPACLQGHRDPPGRDNEVPSVPSCGVSRGTLTAGEGAWQRAGLPAVPWGPQWANPCLWGYPVPGQPLHPCPWGLEAGSCVSRGRLQPSWGTRVTSPQRGAGGQGRAGQPGDVHGAAASPAAPEAAFFSLAQHGEGI